MAVTFLFVFPTPTSDRTIEYVSVVHAQELPKETASPVKRLPLCSCILYARALGVAIPNSTDAVDLKPNSVPVVGGLVLLTYSSGISHVAVITALLEGGVMVTEANYRRCKEGQRLISWKDPNLRGFWVPSP